MIENKKILILGMARSGYEVAKLLSKGNNEILITDQKDQDEIKVQELASLGIKFIKTTEPEALLDETFNILIKNPAVFPYHPCVEKAKSLNIPVVNEMEVAYHYINKPVKIIGVTGSNGKTTTVTLIHEVLKRANVSVKLGGNIGTPLSQIVNSLEDNDILLLEIEMKKMDGVTLARMIRKSNKSVQILFITGYSQYIVEGYDVEALHYLMKPIKEEKMFDVLDRAVTKLIQNEKHLLLKLSDEMIKIPLHEIIYIDVNRNYVTIHANKDYTLKKTLGEIEKELDEKFFRIGRSAIVNLKYITRITKTEVFLSNGFSLPLPRGIYDALNRAIINEI